MGKKQLSRRPRRTHKELTRILFESVSQMIDDQRFREIGINDLVEFAGIEKNFIYKHYGDIEGVLKEYVKMNDYWGKVVVNEDVYSKLSMKELFGLILHEMYESFTENVDFQNIIRWEIASSSEYVKENAKKREEDGKYLIDYANTYLEENPEKDVIALFSLFGAGIYYLILHKNISNFVGIDFTDKKQADRLLSVIDQAIEYFFEDHIKAKDLVAKLLKKNMSVDEIAGLLDIKKEKVESYISK